MSWRVRKQAWLEDGRVGYAPRGLPRRLRPFTGAAALAASAALALCFGLREPPSASSAARYQVGYQCWRNIYDCRDFRTQAEAQAIYEACGGPRKDVHHFDWDGNGRACDHLP